MKRMTLEAKLYYGSPGATAGTLATNARDMTVPFDPTKVDISDRGCSIAVYGPGMAELSIQWESNWSDTDAFVQQAYAAAVGRTPIALRTKDFITGKGVDADFIIVKADWKGPLKEGQKVDFEAVPTDLSGRSPQAYV